MYLLCATILGVTLMENRTSGIQMILQTCFLFNFFVYFQKGFSLKIKENRTKPENLYYLVRFKTVLYRGPYLVKPY